MKQETLARIVLVLLLLAAAAAGFAAFYPAHYAPSGVTLHARMPENGGWSQDTLTVAVGQPLRLRMTSDDVLHSFAVGQSDQAPVDIQPGEWRETTLVFDKPGRYTFYCTRWCGRNHWRMRGTILVTGGKPAAVSPVEQPLYLRLGLDIDAPHQAGDIPAAPPSSDRGAALAARLPAGSLDRQAYLENSPAAIWLRLRAEPMLKDLSDAALWDAAAFLWARQAAPAALAEGKQIYAANCAACHGETGRGDGVMAAGLPRYTPGKMAPGEMDAGEMNAGPYAPPDLTDPRTMLGASPALLQGKLLRGGMGTGMPNWGEILTPVQMDAVVAYMYTFAMRP